MAAFQASWRKIAESKDIRRSSQTISITDNEVLLFGGEIQPRQPVDNKLYKISLSEGAPKGGSVNALNKSSAPSARVGSASATLNGVAYLFSGRGGEAMAPIEENGALHILDLVTGDWSLLKPTDASKPYPQARSYHAMTSDGHETIYLHAGCPEKGRLSDLWAFDIGQRQWTQLTDAPGAQRGGPSIAFVNGKLYRMNGFDGKNEQGFALDIYDPTSKSWSTVNWGANEGPSPRSVGALLPIKIKGQDSLITMFGESDPSNLGHQGAGKMLDDVWVFDLASGKWTVVDTDGSKPQPRGWFATDCLQERNQIVVQGGLAENNERIGDLWTLAF